MSSILALIAPYCSGIVVTDKKTGKVIPNNEVHDYICKDHDNHPAAEARKVETSKSTSSGSPTYGSMIEKERAEKARKAEEARKKEEARKAEEAKRSAEAVKEEKTVEVSKPKYVHINPIKEEKAEIKVETKEEKVDAEIVNSSGDVITTQDKKACPVTITSIEEKKEEVKEQKPQLSTDNVITMQNRKVCPVNIMNLVKDSGMKVKVPTNSEKNQNRRKEEEHRLQHLTDHLRKTGVKFTLPQRMPTGLYELDIIQFNGNPVKISVDINGLLYSNDMKFFFWHINPGDEYSRSAIVMTDESVLAVARGDDETLAKYYVPEKLFQLNRILDLQSLKETNDKKRTQTFEKVSKIIFDPDIYNAITEAIKGEPYRFAFAKYVSPNEFTIVSSRRNLASNLSNTKLLVSKEIWISIKRGKDAKLEIKDCSK